MKEIKKKYCYNCGTLEVKNPTGKFSTKTGKPLFETHCPNLNCELGCDYAGHIYKFLSDTCKRCGHNADDYLP